LPEGWNESVIVPVYTMGDKTLQKLQRHITLSDTYKILPSIILSKLIRDAEEIIGDHQCGLQCSGSTTGQIFCIHQILEKKWEFNEAVHQLFIDFKKAYD